MSELGFFGSDPIQYHEIVLERSCRMAVARVSELAMRDARLTTWQDDLTRTLVARLSKDVMEHRLLVEDRQVPFQSYVEVEVEPDVALAPYFTGAVAALGLAAGITLSVVLLAVALVVAVAGSVVALSDPPRVTRRRVPVSGEVTVRASMFNAFPESTMVYPDHLGAPVRIVTTEQVG